MVVINDDFKWVVIAATVAVGQGCDTLGVWAIDGSPTRYPELDIWDWISYPKWR